MKRIPIISTVESTASSILKARNPHDDSLSIFQVINYEDALSVLKYDLPEIKILDFGDPNGCAEECLKIIQSDPWLLFGGVIAVVNNNAEKIKLEERKEPNFLFVTTRHELEEHATQIIKILKNHQQFLFNRRAHIDLTSNENGQFISETDPFEILFYGNLLSTYLYNTNRVNLEERTTFQGALMELLLNAVEHGNCEITYQEKTKWLESGKNILDLIKIKHQDPTIQNRKIYITYEITPKTTEITIRDEGKGFNWRTALKKEVKAGLHGMGIKMSQTMVQNLRYNDSGNEVSFNITNQKNTSNLTPALLKSQQILSFRHMQIVCRENEESNDIFYISSGRFAVYLQNKLITVLTPADIFIGEMAFLLNDKRSATVVAIGEGTLIKIEKMKFMKLISQHPHYGIFLAKLIAQRLTIQAKKTTYLKVQVDQINKK